MPIHTRFELLKRRRTKIMATLGPASDDAETLLALIDAGAELFRLNMSHGTHESHEATYLKLRRAAQKRQVEVTIMADLSGPKIRVGRFPDGEVELTDDAIVTVTTRDVMGAPDLVSTGYPTLAKDVDPGSRILLNDGRLELVVESIEGRDITCRVIVGGALRDRKGMNLPGVQLSTPALTDKDRRDAEFALGLGVDLLALSFVRSGADVKQLRELVEAHDGDADIVSKIEKSEALEDIDAILELSDAILVARGDLGVEMQAEMLPLWQDKLVKRARSLNKPSIVATQMLDSMIERDRPTRAEVSDVAQSVRSGTDALMLSGETAVGAHPVAAVKALDSIIRHTEGYQWAEAAFGDISASQDSERPLPIAEAMGLAVAQLSRDLEVRGVLVVSRTGTSARMVAAARPAAPVIAVTGSARVRRLMNLFWGVIPLEVSPNALEDPLGLGRELAQNLDLAEPGHKILVVRGFHDLPSLNQPTMTVLSL